MTAAASTASPSGPSAWRGRNAGIAALGAAVAVVALGVAADLAYFGNAIVIEWRVPAERHRPSTLPDVTVSGGTSTEPVVIGTTVEHDVSIPSSHRAITRYVELWRVAEHGVPRALPALDAVVRARMLVPSGAPRGVSVRTGDHVEVSADGEPLERTDRLAPGWHEITVHWTGELVGRAEGLDRTSFELAYENGAPVPRAHLRPPADFPDGDWPATRRWLWVLVAALSVVLSTMAARAASAPTPALARSRTLAIATLLVVLFGSVLRAYDYDLEPHPLENYDEYFNLWNGWSLLEDGSSRGWSAWPSAYWWSTTDSYEVDFWGNDLVMVEPYFENMPLMHLLVGGAAHVAGATDYRDARVADGRIVSLLLSALTIWLLILVTGRIVRAGPGPWLAGLLWASTPTLVIQTRVIKEELLVVPLALGTLYFLLRWLDEGKAERDLWLAATCAGLAVLAKIPAVMLVVGLLMLLVARRELRAARTAALVSSAAGGIPLLALVLWQGPRDFLTALSAQVQGRGTHFNLFSRYLDAFQVNGWFMGRGWLLFLWVAALGALYTWSPQRRALVAIPLALYFTAIGVGAGNYTHGWLILPVIAYLCIAAGAFLGDLYREPDLLRGLLFGLLFVMYTLNFVVPVEALSDPATGRLVRPAVTGAVLALVAPYCAVQVWPRWRPLARGSFVVAMTVTLVVFSSVVLRWEELFATYHNMDRALFFP